MKHILISTFLLFIHVSIFAQCQFNLDSYTHVNCYSENTGTIDISFIDPNISFFGGLVLMALLVILPIYHHYMLVIMF